MTFVRSGAAVSGSVLILSAVLILAPGTSAASPGAGADLSAAIAKKHKRHCKKAAGAKRKRGKSKCKTTNSQDSEAGGAPTALALSGCPTGTASGSLSVSLTGTITPVPPAGRFSLFYTQWDGANYVYQAVLVSVSGSGTWSYSFTPNTGAWLSAGSWSERVMASYNSGSGQDTPAECTWLVSS